PSDADLRLPLLRLPPRARGVPVDPRRGAPEVPEVREAEARAADRAGRRDPLQGRRLLPDRLPQRELQAGRERGEEPGQGIEAGEACEAGEGAGEEARIVSAATPRGRGTAPGRGPRSRSSRGRR